ncbi:hypothetical protein Dsin_007910 [Dipteronia sinensis]|uniref:DUF4283 domain-containing protein n=1 Tax=Dipteronia sinensis TaxID=43782 RepID=A0AAE0B1X4_9ROSI|nr:hypothetical protein Dsin_007910 [Dipteronia sinensis]
MKLSENLKLKLCKSWENSVILKIMGRTHTLNFMLAKLRQKWPLIGHWQLTDLDHGYFVARFQKLEDLRLFPTNILLFRSEDLTLCLEKKQFVECWFRLDFPKSLWNGWMWICYVS